LRRFNKKGLFGIILKEPIRRTEEASQEVPQSGCTH
jgi:hypothetical protein